MTRVVVPAALLLVLLAPGSASAVTAEQKYAHTAHAATNAERRAEDLRPLREDDCLTRFAARQAERMAARREIFHQELGPVLRRCRMSFVGENVAYGYRTGSSVVREGWMNSKGHRENILRPQFTMEGIAARKAGGSWYVAQVFGRE